MPVCGLMPSQSSQDALSLQSTWPRRIELPAVTVGVPVLGDGVLEIAPTSIATKQTALSCYWWMMARRRSCSDRDVTVLMRLLYSSKTTVWNLPMYHCHIEVIGTISLHLPPSQRGCPVLWVINQFLWFECHNRRN